MKKSCAGITLAGDIVERVKIIDLVNRCPFLWYRWYPFVNRQDMVEFHANRILSGQKEKDVVTVTTHDRDRLTSLLQVGISEWDTKHFGLKMARVNHVYGTGEGEEGDGAVVRYRELLALLDAECPALGIEHMSLAADGVDVRLIQAANLAGFIVVALNTYHFFIPSKGKQDLPADRLAGHVRALRPDDVPQIASAARGMFRWTRFHADPWLDREKADEVYERRLAQLAFDPETARVYVVEHDGKPVAFMAARVVKEAGIRVGLLDLTVILSEARGLYYYLLLHALHDLADVDVIEMTTDLRNLVVRNTWAQLKLPSFGTRMYLHKRYTI